MIFTNDSIPKFKRAKGTITSLPTLHRPRPFQDAQRFAGTSCWRQHTQAVGSGTQEQLRASDVIARYGGDEFAVILPETDLEGALHIAERVRSEVESRRFSATTEDRLLVGSSAPMRPNPYTLR